MQKVIEEIILITDNVQNDKVTLYSAQASFFMIISVVPFIMLLFILAGNLITAAKDEFLGFFIAMPSSVSSLISLVVDEITNKNVSSSLSFSAVILFWTSSRSVLALEKGLDSVYHSDKSRGIIMSNLYAFLYTFALLLMIIFSLVLMVFGNTIGEMLASAFPAAAKVVDAILSARSVLAIVILTLVFACMYKFVPSRKLKFKKQLPGALFAAGGWIIFSLLFSIYVDNFSNKSYIYGSLTAIIILMLWIYFCMIILFIGGEINYFLLDEE